MSLSAVPNASDDGIKDKISLFCNVDVHNVIENLDVDVLYEAPLALEKEKLAQVVCKRLGIDCPEPDLDDWKAMIHAWKNPTRKVRIALVGKYVQLHDAYISVVESLKHAACANGAEVEIQWVDSELVSSFNVADILKDADGILVPAVLVTEVSKARSPLLNTPVHTMYHSLVSALVCRWQSLSLPAMYWVIQMHTVPS